MSTMLGLFSGLKDFVPLGKKVSTKPNMVRLVVVQINKLKQIKENSKINNNNYNLDRSN